MQVRGLLLIILLFIPIRSWGQTAKVQNVRFQVKPDQTVLVTYYISGVSTRNVQNIKLLFSIDGGKHFSRVWKISGDVDRVSSVGYKSIIWNAQEERRMVLANQAQFDVVATPVLSRLISDLTEGMLVGNRYSKRRLNGYYFSGGYHTTIFTGEYISSLLKEGSIEAKVGFNVGLKIILLPIMIEFFYLRQQFDDIDGMLKPYLDYSYELWNHGASISVSYTILPIFEYAFPHIGVGYQESSLSLKPDYAQNTESETSSAFYTAGLHYSMTDIISLSLSYYRAFLSTAKAWDSLNFGFQIRFSL